MHRPSLLGRHARERNRRNYETRRHRLAAARARGTHTDEQWQQLVEACGHRCVRCGAAGVPLTRDHITPLFCGGSDGIENIQPLCGSCNSAKGGERIDHRPMRARAALAAE